MDDGVVECIMCKMICSYATNDTAARAKIPAMIYRRQRTSNADDGDGVWV